MVLISYEHLMHVLFIISYVRSIKNTLLKIISNALDSLRKHITYYEM
jgi:hypothetical protein